MIWGLMACVYATSTVPVERVSELVPMVAAEAVDTGAEIHSDDERIQAMAAVLREDNFAWTLLTQLCDNVGPRLAGSSELEDAVVWSEGHLQEMGLSSVWTEEVMVPSWERGSETLSLISPYSRELAVLGLGGTIGGDVEAPVVVIRNFDELGPHVAGHVVLYNVPMSEGVPSVSHYGPAVKYRLDGASRAAEHGAVGVLVRSVTTRSLYTPHTGVMRYAEGVEKIPAASITTEDADLIARLTESGQPVSVQLSLGASQGEDVVSHNVIAEIKGSQRPEEIILIGAHLDSWDVGQGAHDDGAGVVEVMAAMQLLAGLPTPPNRTIRVVLFTNEENGLRGGKAYALEHASENHVAALESDLGGGWPLGFGATGTPDQLAWLQAAAAPLGLPVSEGGGGADIGPLKAHGTLVVGLRPDDRHYFDIHHTHADTLDKVDPAAIVEATIAIAGLALLMAEQ